MALTGGKRMQRVSGHRGSVMRGEKDD